MTNSNAHFTANHHLDTQGLICPEPVMMLHKTIRRADSGDIIEVLATDPATTRDIPNFCRHLGHELLTQETVSENVTLSVDPDEIIIDSDIVNNANDEQASVTLYRYLVKKKSA